MKRSPTSVISLCLLGSLVACSSAPRAANKDERTMFTKAYRQLAPEPIYSRMTLVYPPEPLPDRTMPYQGAPVILPSLRLELKKTRLEDAARMLASTSSYTSYCSSLIANDHITLVASGTIEELAQQIADNAKIKVVIDHANREVRFMSLRTLENDIQGSPLERTQ